ncbi:extracellular solute-binding protein [Candidatus Gottesmanbacteria bacterium]|nr:extracellular solute-binding protein [Candidatus Gottesmanbacteria bacterium]
MDNIPKEKNQDQSQSTGDIFSNNPSESAYQEATATPETESNVSAQVYQENQTQVPQEVPIGENQSDGGSAPPPPYTEDNKKKKLIFFAIAGVIILIIFLVFSLLVKSKPQTPQTITLDYWGLWEDKNILQSIIDEYKKNHSNININYIKQDPKLYRERLAKAIDKGEGPDLFRFHNTWVPMMKSYLSIMPSNIYSADDFKKIFFPVATDDLKQNGNIYGIPLMIDGLLLFYNEDILKANNIAVPKTWDEIQKIVVPGKLTVVENGKIVTAGIALGTAENIEHFSDILGLMFLQNGTKLEKSLFSCATSSTANILDSTNSTSNSSSTTCGTETLAYYHKFAELPNNSWDETLENSIVAFAGGKVAIILAPSWEAFTIKELSKNSNLNFKTAKVPQLPCDKQPCVTVNWATYWVEGVSNKSKYQKESWEFLKYLSDANTMRKLYEKQSAARSLFGEPYSRVDLAKSLSDHPYLGPLIAEAPTMKSFFLASRTNDGDNGLDTKLIDYLKNAVNSLSKGVSSETALKTADEGFKQIYTRWELSAAAATQ